MRCRRQATFELVVPAGRHEMIWPRAKLAPGRGRVRGRLLTQRFPTFDDLDPFALAAALTRHPRNRLTPTCIPIVQRTVKDSSAGTQPLVYLWCMTRTNIDIDDHACEVVMRRFHLTSKRDAVNFALRNLAQEALDLKAARELRGSGWDADLDELRSDRVR